MLWAATKLFCQSCIFKHIAELSSGTEFAIVRLGNVLGSSWFVVPPFLPSKSKRAGPITRHSSRILFAILWLFQEAAQLVFQGPGANGPIRAKFFVIDSGAARLRKKNPGWFSQKMGHTLWDIVLKVVDNPNGTDWTQVSLA